MKGQALHSSRLRLELRQHLTLANCLRYDLHSSYKVKFSRNTDAFSKHLIGCPKCSSPYCITSQEIGNTSMSCTRCVLIGYAIM
ncbi:hypothetical protein ALC53_01373 [Atta colombica]|uniref:Uncharacterized protein n=1 Tax=Atta colombica TaxID=520822 RepID=A0A195BUW2_9HYME|nr:hypothetical protein ALC53_01373 [Atta colombica]